MAELEDLLLKLSISAPSETTKRTGLVFDDRMTDHRCLYWPEHEERPERYIYSLERCKTYDLIKECTLITPRFASEYELLSIHDAEYLKAVKETKHESDITKLEEVASRYDAVYFHPKTYDNALLAAGCALELVSSVIEGKTKNGMAIIRPPGHHAMEKAACGFCYFNNVAIAAKHAFLKYDLKRILIIDWDVHHGQATQQMFYDDPRLLYFSIHRYEHGLFWPNLRESNFDYIGQGAGRGFNVNVPLNKTKLGNSEYLAIFHNVLLPIAYEFDPELVLISAGYDAAIGCPEGEMEVSPMAYPHFLSLVSGLANGRICVLLEGGYCLPSLSEGVALTLRGLLGKPCPKISQTDMIDESVVETILNVITILRPFWKSLRLQDTIDDEPTAYSEETRKRHQLVIKYLGNNSKPAAYETRDCCPIQEASIRVALEVKLEKLIGETDLSVPKNRTCFVTDEQMMLHINEKDKGHPENPERLKEIHTVLLNSGLLAKCSILKSRQATKEELGLIHNKDYIDKVETTASMTSKDLQKMEKNYDSIYLCNNTYQAAKFASGCLLQAVDSVLMRESGNGFALIRPPGHHAEVDEACGFCLFNSVSVAAMYALSHHHLKKVLILDWDVHHGNGTQHIFYNNSSVLYISLHRFDQGSFFPGAVDASHVACGENAGLGFNINIPWNAPAADGDYLSAFFHIILPVCYEYCPDLVIVSSGFDAVECDPLGECLVTPACFGHMTKLLSGLANGKIILALEGGYNLRMMPEAALQCVRALLDEDYQPVSPEACPSPSAITTIRNVIQVHQKYWKCLQFGVDVPTLNRLPEEQQPIKPPGNGAMDCQHLSSPVAIPAEEQSYLKLQTIFPPNEAIGITEDIWSNAMFCVTPLENCPHLELLQSLPLEGLSISTPCQICGDISENWVCLHCYQVFCGRFVNKHMMEHGSSMQHCLTLSYCDLSVWCYGCDSYVHNEVLMPVKQHVHHLKFGVGVGE